MSTTEATDLQEYQSLAPAPIDVLNHGKVSAFALITNEENMARVTKFADTMASSKVTVPKHLQGNPGDCAAIIIQAAQWGMNPYAVAQKTHLVNGVLGYEAQLVNAVLQSMGIIEGEFVYDYKGTSGSIECRVGASPRGRNDVLWSEWLNERDVTTKNSPLWKTNPKQQMGYLQVKNWARKYYPGA
ncbi:MAG: recombinase RecT, partial [Methylobacillus glycogenes]|nr:recombinase RecT [Methylobacillus glycogenes]